MPLVCPGRCNTDTTTVTYGEPVWCPPCSQVTRTALRALPAAYLALGSVAYLSASQATDAIRVSGSRDRPSPAPGVDLQDELFQTIRSWEDDVRHHQHHRAARDTNERHTTLVGAVRYLNRNFADAMARDPGGKEFGQEMNMLFSSVLRMVKNGPLRHVLGVPCPHCNRKALMQQEGLALTAWYTACERRLGGCGYLYTETEMSWMTEMYLAGAR